MRVRHLEGLRQTALAEELRMQEGKREEEAKISMVEKENEVRLEEVKKLNLQRLEQATSICEENIRKLGIESEGRLKKKIDEQEAMVQALRKNLEEEDYKDMHPKEVEPTPFPECPVCMDQMMGHIYQCGKGHLVCGDCKPKLKGCPSKCGTLLLSYRAFGVEQYAASLS